MFSSVWLYCVSTLMCPLPEHTCETIPFMQVSFWFPFIISPMAVGYCTVDFIGQTVWSASPKMGMAYWLRLSRQQDLERNNILALEALWSGPESELVAGVARILCLPLFAAGFSNRCYPLGMPGSHAYGRLLLVSFCTASDSGHKEAVSSIFHK